MCLPGKWEKIRRSIKDETLLFHVTDFLKVDLIFLYKSDTKWSQTGLANSVSELNQSKERKKSCPTKANPHIHTYVCTYIHRYIHTNAHRFRRGRLRCCGRRSADSEPAGELACAGSWEAILIQLNFGLPLKIKYHKLHCAVLTIFSDPFQIRIRDICFQN